ncbi:MAG: hypothetical protein WC549_02025 [Actinomycetota bacterium]
MIKVTKDEFWDAIYLGQLDVVLHVSDDIKVTSFYLRDRTSVGKIVDMGVYPRVNEYFLEIKYLKNEVKE